MDNPRFTFDGPNPELSKQELEIFRKWHGVPVMAGGCTREHCDDDALFDLRPDDVADIVHLAAWRLVRFYETRHTTGQL